MLCPPLALLPALLYPLLALAADPTPDPRGSITFYEPPPGGQCNGDTEKHKINIQFSSVNGWITPKHARLTVGAVEQCENVWRVVPEKKKDPKDDKKKVDVVPGTEFEVIRDGKAVKCKLSGTLMGERADFFVSTDQEAGYLSKPCSQYGVTLSCEGEECLKS